MPQICFHCNRKLLPDYANKGKYMCFLCCSYYFTVPLFSSLPWLEENKSFITIEDAKTQWHSYLANYTSIKNNRYTINNEPF